MSNSTKTISLVDLPFELVLKISSYLRFADVWYLGTCSKLYRQLAYQILFHDYNINLIKPFLINPLDNLIHAAVAFLSRHCYSSTTNNINQSILNSVSNRLAKEIYYRTPESPDFGSSLEFLLDKSFITLFSHIFCD
ncbi:hypothetical protein J3Q64DRAFT_1706942, partial [Phycomyces blakesleeanus]